MSAPVDLTDSVAGQVIDRALKRGRLAHALLLYGAGIETLEAYARQIAARLLALSPEWAAGSEGHPDFATLRPSGKSRQIKIGERDSSEPGTMRHFIRQLAQSPLAAERKVGVVFEAERLNPNSANAFLKTLEEPPLDTTILLLTPRPYSLLPTIRSRCLHFRLPAGGADALADDPEVQAWLEDFRAWLRSLGHRTGEKAEAARQVMTVYGLVARFAHWLDEATTRALGELKSAGALQHLDSDETEALKTSTAVGVRQRFFAAVENATCAAGREDGVSSMAAPTAVHELERAAGLLRVNFQENAALELFLLSTLRAWAQAGRDETKRE